MPSSRSSRQDLVLEVAGEERVLGLQRGDRVRRRARGGWSSARGLRQPEVAHLAGLDQLGHGADGLLDRDGLVDAVLVVEVDVVDAEALRGEASQARADVVGRAVDAEPAAVGRALVAELGGEHDLVAAAGDGAADQLLVGERAVHVGGVEEGDAEVEGAVDGVDARRPRRRCRRTPTSPCSRGRGPRRSVRCRRRSCRAHGWAGCWWWRPFLESASTSGERNPSGPVQARGGTAAALRARRRGASPAAG